MLVLARRPSRVLRSFRPVFRRQGRTVVPRLARGTERTKSSNRRLLGVHKTGLADFAQCAATAAELRQKDAARPFSTFMLRLFPSAQPPPVALPLKLMSVDM